MAEEKYWKNDWLPRANNYLGLSRRMLDLEWVDRQILKGKLRTGYRQAIERLTPVLEEVYPSRWDIQFDTTIHFTEVTNLYRPIEFNHRQHNLYVESYNGEESLEEYLSYNSGRRALYIETVYVNISEYCITVPVRLNISDVYIIIHFPEVIITNSDGESLVIKDLFTRTILYANGTIGTSLQGTRTTFSIPEVSTRYIHSHLHSMQWVKLKDSPTSKITFTKFCLGHSDLIDFAHLYNADKNLGNFESYLHMLQTIASWESLEGGPHMKIQDTVQRTLDVPDVTKEECDAVVYRMAQRLDYDTSTIDWVFRNNKYIIIDNEKFEDLLRSAYSSNPGNPIGVFKDETGRYFVPSGISEEIIKNRNVDFIPFRGQKFQLKVEGELKLVNKHKWYINPKIKQYVKSKLESICNKAETKKYSIEWLHQVSNNGRVSQ